MPNADWEILVWFQTTVGANYTSKVLQIKLRDSSLTPFLPKGWRTLSGARHRTDCALLCTELSLPRQPLGCRKAGWASPPGSLWRQTASHPSPVPGRRPPGEFAIGPHPRSIRASPPVAKEKPLSDQEWRGAGITREEKSTRKGGGNKSKHTTTLSGGKKKDNLSELSHNT